MNTENKIKLPMSFWLITIVMLLWNVMGSINLLWQLTASADVLAAFPKAHRAIIMDRPLWATIGFAIGVFGGVLGCLLLMLRKTLARGVFIVSLVGIVITMINTILVTSSVDGFGFVEIFMMIIIPVLVAVFLVWYSSAIEKNGWLEN